MEANKDSVSYKTLIYTEPRGLILLRTDVINVAPGPFSTVELYFSLLTLAFGCFLQDGTDAVVKDVLPGDSVHSLLSVLDIITVPFQLHLWHTCIYDSDCVLKVLHIVGIDIPCRPACPPTCCF